MRKLLLLMLLLLLVGCQKSEVIDTDKYTYFGTFENGVDVYVEAYEYFSQKASWETVLVKNNRILKVLDHSTSQPVFSKDRKKIIYVQGLQFESIGNVVIYDSVKDEKILKTTFDFGQADESVKFTTWYDDNQALVVIGYAYGTITQGGVLKMLDLESGEINDVLSTEVLDGLTDRPFEVVTVSKSINGLKVWLVEWLDDDYITYCYTDHYIPLRDTLLEE